VRSNPRFQEATTIQRPCNTIPTESDRRLRPGSLVAVLVAALAVLAACQHAPRAQASPASQQAATKRYLTIGMTKKQMVRLIGKPKTIRGSYWYYPVVHGFISKKVPVVVYGTNVFQPANQFRAFWYGGVLQGEEIHVKVPGKTYIWRAVLL